MISAVVLTKNEEDVILTCLNSLTWCSQIIIIDDFSTDNTLKKIGGFKLKVDKTPLAIKVYKRHLDNDFSKQRNFGLMKASGEWVLFVDADEIVTNKLQKEIIEKIKNDDNKHNGFYLKRRDIFLGKELKYGEVGETKLVRLARKSYGTWRRKVHEKWEPFKLGEEIGVFDNPLVHYSHHNLWDFIEKVNYFSDLHALALKKEGKKANIVKIIIWPTGKFIVNYFFKLGFLDGTRGFMMASVMSFHSFLAWSKRWTL